MKNKIVFRVELVTDTNADRSIEDASFELREKIKDIIEPEEVQIDIVNLSEGESEGDIIYSSREGDYADYLDHCANLWESNRFGEPNAQRAFQLRQRAKELRSAG